MLRPQRTTITDYDNTTNWISLYPFPPVLTPLRPCRSQKLQSKEEQKCLIPNPSEPRKRRNLRQVGLVILIHETGEVMDLPQPKKKHKTKTSLKRTLELQWRNWLARGTYKCDTSQIPLFYFPSGYYLTRYILHICIVSLSLIICPLSLEYKLQESRGIFVSFCFSLTFQQHLGQWPKSIMHLINICWNNELMAEWIEKKHSLLLFYSFL